MPTVTKGRRLTSRRTVLGGSAALLASVALPAVPRAQPTVVRQSINSANLRAQNVASYKAAIRAMLALPASDPRNWYRQALTHMLDCPHGNWWFTSWHRGYLSHFEQICRELSNDPEFALPYWDWTRDPRIPAVMFEDVLDPRNSAYPLADFNQFRTALMPSMQQLFTNATPSQRQVFQLRNYASAQALMTGIGDDQLFSDRPGARGSIPANGPLPPDAARAVSIEIITDAVRRAPFESFGSGVTANHIVAGIYHPLESQPHNNVHGALGGEAGFMGSMLSPIDPIFWLHHANVDRLWDVWTRRQRAAGLPHLPAGTEGERWQNEVHAFFVDPKGQPVGDRTTRNYVDNVALGYTYEPGAGEELVGQAPVTSASAARPGTAARVLTTQGAVQNLQIGRAASRTVALSGDIGQILSGGSATPVAPSSDPIRDAFRESPGSGSRPPAPAAPPARAALPLIAANVALALPSRARNLRYDVFLNSPNVSSATPLTDQHYVGTIFAFGMEHMAVAGGHAGHSGHGAPGTPHNMAYSLPLGPTIERLKAAGVQLGANLNVQVVPRATGRIRESSNSVGTLTSVSIEVS